MITHYAFHTVYEEGIGRAYKTLKSDAIKLLEINGNSAVTWIWNYSSSKWKIGENVEVVNGRTEKYLRSDPDNTKTDNLAHLLDFDWVAPL
ncbi:DUF3892 domain-containing protein [Fulvivirga ulvae]|nr:DUF3892 domain-containing protein [Fulvivirga ulvae]